ncbi:hypothetical protein GUJ93_ZPchr0003g18515 [Zizania palustris]|uniref:Cytochrome P450 n=1 Tax=Zizania palustris TaxID=103762 RepID=A0A8J5SC19_ZIZPA|nr:hypothetical protein GUJ93_ZPchr0003g18515 [Zizania palustris]
MAASHLLLELLLQQWQLSTSNLILLAIVSVVSVQLLRMSRRNSGLKLPPGPTRLPIVGNLHQIGPLPHRSLQALARRHGPVMMLKLGMVPTVVLSSPEAAREAMKTHDADCSNRPDSPGPRLLSYGYRDVAFSPYSEYVRDMRKLLISDMLCMRRVQAASYAREAQVEKLIENITRMGRNAVDINEHIFATVDGIIGTFAFGETYAAQQFKEKFVDVINEAVVFLSSFSAEDFFPNAAGRLVDRLTGVAARREGIFMELDGFFERIIDQYSDPAGRKNDDGSDLVHKLIDLWKMDGTTKRFTRDNVKAMLMNTFIGGNDTSSVTMHWAMAELMRNPRVLKKVQDEIRAVVGKKERVHHDDMRKLKYLRMVVKETMRLHPPGTLVAPRETIRHIKLGGYDIPVKTKVIVNVWAIGRDPKVWKDPEEFCPDRFEEINIDFNGAHFELIPFGSGCRICPGVALAMLNMEFILANMLFCFNWELPEGMTKEDIDVEEVGGGLIFYKKTPLLLLAIRQHTTE